jgi:hypothetical protein
MRLSCSRLSSRPTTTLPLLENFRPTTSRLCIAGSLPRFATSAQRFISVSFVSSRPHSAMDTNVATTTTPTTDSIAPASTSKVGSEVVATHDEATAVEKKDLHEKKKKKKKDDDGVYLPFKIAAAVPISPDTKLFRFQVPADQAQLLRTLPSPGMPADCIDSIQLGLILTLLPSRSEPHCSAGDLAPAAARPHHVRAPQAPAIHDLAALSRPRPTADYAR